MISIMSEWTQIFDAAPVLEVEKGTTLFHREDRVRYMFLVRSGTIALERPMEDGSALTLHMASRGMGLAEASLFSDTYHCDAVARTHATVARLARADFLAALRERPEAALSLIKTHARDVQSQRARIEILRLRRVADRLDAWLDLHGDPPKGGWTAVAEQIGVSPPALYRELARRRR